MWKVFNSGHLVGPAEAAEATKKKQVTQWRRSYAVPPPPIKVRFITMKHRGGGGGMLKDSCQRVILAGETFEGFVAVETRISRYFKRSNFEI